MIANRRDPLDNLPQNISPKAHGLLFQLRFHKPIRHAGFETSSISLTVRDEVRLAMRYRPSKSRATISSARNSSQ